MENHFYLGIDLDDQNAVISCYELNRREPETLSMVAGSEAYQIPVLLAKKKGVEQWSIGEDAKRLAISQGEEETANLLTRALKREMVFVDGERYLASELLCLYLKKLLLLAGRLGNHQKPNKLVICLKRLSREATELFAEIVPKLGLQEKQVTLLDRKECFYYFAYHQPKDLTLHDIFLFDYKEEDIFCCRLTSNQNTKPQIVTLVEEIRSVGTNHKDESFFQILQDCFAGRIVSSSYLTGGGFDGGWMKQSVSFLCQGRRAFMGKNLYSKGACYAAAVQDGQKEWNYVYLGDNEMKVNVSLKVLNKDTIEFFTLINAGDNWYETVGKCEVILDGTPEIAFWLQPPKGREAKIERLELSDLPKRPNKMTRLRIIAKPLSDEKVQIQIRDLGFGDFYKSSGKIWEYVMSFAEGGES